MPTSTEHTEHLDGDHEHNDSHRPGPKGHSADQKVMGNMAKGLALGVLVLALLALIVVSIGLYRWQWENPVTDAVVHALPYPAATVNGKIIRYSDYNDDLATVRRFFSKQQEQAGGEMAVMPTEEELRKGVLDRLIQTEILKEEADRYGVTVTQEEIDAEYAKISAGADGDAEAQIQELYGWTPAQFKEKVMRTYLLQTKLAEAVAKDESVSGESKAKAEEALQKLKDGTPFADVAKEYSADPGSAANGGDLGFFGKGVMVPEFEAAAFSLAPGETSGLVQSQFGWHIIKVEEVKKDADGNVTEVKAAHILIAGPSIDEYLKKRLDEAKVTRYVKI